MPEGLNRPALLLALLLGGRAHAEPPACFPERTLWHGAYLVDARGRGIGVVAPGVVVKVVDQHFDEPNRLVDVVLERPFRLEARIPADRLEVYATQDIEVVPSLAWWAAGGPLRIYGARPGEALVGPLHRKVSPADTTGDPLARPAWTKCEALAGTSSRDRGDDCCRENWSYDGHDRAGSKVKTRRSSDQTRVENEAGDAAVSLYAPNLLLLGKKGARSLVWAVTRDGVVVEGWVATPLTRRRDDGPSIISGCLDDLHTRRWMTPTAPLAGLLAETAFSAERGGAFSGTLPAGTRVHVLERTGLLAKVQLRRPSDRPQLIVEGWVATSALSDLDPK
jgi:hypothetical protein